jgi:predicted HAD superfamily phosphohydrolase
MYFAFALLIEQNPLNSALITHPEKIEAIVSKIDNVYKDIKKNEVSPKTDYLFTNLNKSNIEKTIEKIELINSL